MVLLNFSSQPIQVKVGDTIVGKTIGFINAESWPEGGISFRITTWDYGNGNSGSYDGYYLSIISGSGTFPIIIPAELDATYNKLGNYVLNLQIISHCPDFDGDDEEPLDCSTTVEVASVINIDESNPFPFTSPAPWSPGFPYITWSPIVLFGSDAPDNSDPANYQATIDWGDGTTSQGIITNANGAVANGSVPLLGCGGSPGNFADYFADFYNEEGYVNFNTWAVFGNHEYKKPPLAPLNLYMVQVTITGANTNTLSYSVAIEGKRGSELGPFDIKDLKPKMEVSKREEVVIAVLTDYSNTRLPANCFKCKVKCGDGKTRDADVRYLHAHDALQDVSSYNGPVANLPAMSQYKIVLRHKFLDTGRYNLKISVTNNEEGSAHGRYLPENFLIRGNATMKVYAD